MARNYLTICNIGITPTFRNANGSSHIDITMCGARLADKMQMWKVDEDEENLSPHNNIHFTVRSVAEHRSVQGKGGKWNSRSLDLEKMQEKKHGLPEVNSLEEMEREIHKLFD